MREKAERKENRRINRITANINDNVISTKEVKYEVSSISLTDIDDFSIFSDTIHVAGGLLGLATIVLDTLLKVYNLSENTTENIEFISKVLEEFIFKCLKDNQSFQIKYLESQRFNFKDITEERKPELIDFIHDYRRFVNKSLKILIDQNQLPKNALELILSAIVNLYFKDKSNIPVVEINPENQDPEYLQKIKEEQENYTQAITRMEAVKKKINFVMVKPIMLKKRRENMAAFIQIHPNQIIKEVLTETDEIPVSAKTIIPGKNDENPNPDDEQNNEEIENNGENADNEKNINEEKKEIHNVENKEEEQLAINQNIQNEEENKDENIDDENKEDQEKDENLDKSKEGDIKKIEPKIFKVEYNNEAQIFKNEKMKYEPYIIHNKLHEYSLINVAKSFRKIINKKLKIEADLNELVDVSNHAYEKYSQFVVDWILNNEIYIKDNIVPIVISPVVVKPEETEAAIKNNEEINAQNLEQNSDGLEKNEDSKSQIN